MSTLAEAEQHLSKEPELALQRLLSAWQRSRDPLVAGLLSRLGESLLSTPDGLRGNQSERAAALAQRAAASTAGNRSAVLAAMRTHAANATGINVCVAFEAWLQVEEDPRVAHLAAELLTKQGAARDLTAKLMKTLGDCIVRHGHAEVLPTLEVWIKDLLRIAPPFRARASRIVEELRRKPPAIPIDDLAALARLDAQLPKQGVPARRTEATAADGDRLLAAIVASPSDDAPRLAWADWLTEHGDPRGEFVLLQINRAKSKTPKRVSEREAALLEEHRPRFLGALERHVSLKGLRFDRGFLTRCTFKSMMYEFDVPELSLLEDITVVDVFDLSAFKGLRRVQGADLATAWRLPGLVHAELNGVTAAELRSVETNTSLRTLTMPTNERPGEVLNALFSAGMASALEEVELRLWMQVSNEENYHLRPNALLPAQVLAGAPASLRALIVEVDGVRLEWPRGATGFETLRCEVSSQAKNVYFHLVGALTGFVERPLERVEIHFDGRSAPNVEVFLAPVRSAAKQLEIRS